MARAIRTLFLLLFLAVFASIAWVAIRGAQARGHLEDAANHVSKLQQQMKTLDTAAASDTVDTIQTHTTKAHELTSDPVWDTLAKFPWGGQNLAAVSTATSAVDDLAQEGLPALVNAGDNLVTFRAELKNGNLDATPLKQLATDVETLDTSLKQTRQEINGVERRYLVRAVSQALDELNRSLDVAGSVGEQLSTSAQEVGRA
jgi:HAMP domain-containing protein